MAPPIPMARGVKPYSSNGFADAAVAAHTRRANNSRIAVFMGFLLVRRGGGRAGVEEVVDQVEQLADDLLLDQDRERGHQLLALLGGQRLRGELGDRVARFVGIVRVL